MSMKLYVGNLPFSISEDGLNSLFTQFGSVSSATVIIDRATGRSKGFGFVEMSSETDAANAIQTLNGKPYEGRNLTVSEARRPSRDGGDGYRGNRY